jgi:hypothetical protein
MRFAVKKNPFFIILLVIITALVSLGIIFTDEGIMIKVLISILTLFIFIPFMWAFLHSYLEITDDQLIIVFGFYKKKIPLEGIKSVGHTFNPIASPAWTFKRLEIIHKDYSMILVSMPKKEKLFMETLQEKAGHIQFMSKTNKQTK